MLSSLTRIEQDVSSVKSEVTTGFEEVKTGFVEVKTEIVEVKKRLSRLEDTSGNINEKLLRSQIAKMFGEDFSKQYTIKSLQGLVQLLSEANGLYIKREPSEIYFEARKIARKLAEKKVANQILSDFYDAINSNFSDSLPSPCPQTEARETGNVPVEEENMIKLFCAGVISNFQNSVAVQDRDQRILDAFKKSLKLLEFPAKEKRPKNLVDPLKRKLNQLCWFLTLRNIDDQVSTLVTSDGPGMMIGQYIARKERLLQGKQIQEEIDQAGAAERKLGLIWRFLPSLELEMDVKGAVVVVGNVAFIKVAEIKSSYANSRKGKNQIRDRAIVLQWALQKLRPNISQVTLAGHIFVNSSDDFSQEMKYVDSSGMSIFVHPM